MMIIEGTQEERLAYVEWKESRLDATRAANLPTNPPEPRNLDEKGEWEDCEKCGLPLPLSWQNKRGGCVYCPDCIKLPGDI